MLDTLSDIHPSLPMVVGIFVLIFLAFVLGVVAKRILLVVVHKLVSRSKATWDDAFVKYNVGGRLAQVVPLLVIYGGIPAVPRTSDAVVAIISNVSSAFIVVVFMLTITAALSAVNEIYEARPNSRNRPIKGFVQLAQILVYILGIICLIAALMDRSPIILLGGLGAMTAVSMLVFQDTLLSLVASLQLTSQGTVRVGDWLEMPAFNADGDVIDVALYNITVQNWDKTITTIPTYALISESFKNWRGMTASGGRRIKRAVNIDMSSIRFCDEEMLARYEKIQYIAEYIESKKTELEVFNQSQNVDNASLANGRRMTNVGTFRAYVKAYLSHHPMINMDMTFLVRQLQATQYGLPIEVYVFSKDKVWANYEGIQSDIFDHILAVLPEFDLHVYQNPTGADFRLLNS
jgi:miniconductance mechanosensitive channel